jgi:ABC-type lipoprotein release transport system permease subunit
MLFKIAWRNLWRSKRRTLITAGSVFFAVILTILMRSMQTGTYDIMIRNVVEYYTGYIQVHQKGYFKDQILDNAMELSEETLLKIKKSDGISNAVPRIENFALVSGNNNTKGALIVGTDPTEEKQLTGLDKKITSGEYFDQKDAGVMLAEGLAAQLALKCGDTLVILGQGYQGNSASGMYRVTGIVKFGNPELNKRMMYMPLEEAASLFSMPGKVTSLSLGLKDSDKTEEIAAQLQMSLDTSQYEVMGWRELLPDLDQGIEADKFGGYIMVGILYLIICFGIFGTLLMMIAERQHEFGVLIAIGMKKTQLGITVFIELVNIMLIGTFAGMIGAIPVILYFFFNPLRFKGDLAKSYENFGFEPVMQSSLDPAIFLNNTLLVLMLALLLSLYPFFKIKGMNAIDAMRR